MGVTSVRIPVEVEEPLEVLARKLDRSKSYLINQALKEFVARQSLEEQRWEETVVALNSVQAGQFLEEAEVNRWLDSWGREGRRPAPGG